MRVELVGVEELDAASAEQWEAIRRGSRALASPFFSLEFVRVVSRMRPCRVAVIESEGKTAGFFPFEHVRFGISRPVAHPISDHHGPVVPAELRLSPSELLRRCKTLGYRYATLPAEQALFRASHEATQDSPIVLLARAAPSDQARKRNRLAREVGDVRFERDCRDRRVLEQLLGWKREQFARTQFPDFTQEEPWTVDLLRELHGSGSTPGLRPWLSVLWAAGKPIAAHLGLVSQRVWHWWVAGYDAEYARHSPGLLMLHEMLAAAKEEGLEWLDFGTGDEPFKAKYANDALRVARGTAFTTTGRLAFELKQRARSLLKSASKSDP